MSDVPLLEVRDLTVTYPARTSAVRVVDGVSFGLASGEFLGIVGESGSGKTQLLMSLLGLNGPRAKIGGSVRFRGKELVGASERALAQVRGARIGMIFQDPMTALNPYLTVGTQLTEGARHHRGLSRRAARNRALELLESVQVPEPRTRFGQYPHELSGGMRQRVVIAMALVCEPDIVLADEPTTALDVTVQAQILALLRDLRARTRAALILVTHDLGVIAEVADRVAVMYAGRIVEQATAERLFAEPCHPYTQVLRSSILELEGALPETLPTLKGSPPDPAALGPGCAFAPRCPHAFASCHARRPPLEEVAPGHSRACFHPGPLARAT